MKNEDYRRKKGPQKPRKSHQAVNKIDDLPDHLIQHVLSFLLDAKSLARTSVLCKRWRTLWKGTPALNFCCSDQPSVRTGVEKLLTYLSSGQQKSLRTLRLTRSVLPCPSAIPGLCSLTTLELADCSFDTGSAILLPLADLPSLKCLKLMDCSASRMTRVIVSVPHVLDLEIRAGDLKIEQLLAPKLESFTFSMYTSNLDVPGEVCYSLPSLNHASIRLFWEEPNDRHFWTDWIKRRQSAFMTVFRGMSNAKSLDLRFAKQHESRKTPWKYFNDLLNKIKSLATNRGSPFTSLEILRIQHPRDPPLHGYHVIHYRFEDGSYVKTIR